MNASGAIYQKAGRYGVIGNRELDVIEQVRYDFPKTWNTIGRFSTFKSLGPYLRYENSVAEVLWKEEKQI